MARTTSPVLIVGSGLLGASIGLALRGEGVDVIVTDVSVTSQALAVDYGAGRLLQDSDEPALVVVATPPDVAAGVVLKQLEAWPDAVVTDVVSVKTSVLSALEATGADLSHYVGSHPMAGRERGGVMSARADLFVGRPWVISAHPGARAEAIEAIERLALDVQAVPVRLGTEAHDRAVAFVSHVPQVISTILAKQLNDAEGKAVELAGQGLRDTTRIAASDPGLWLQVLDANAGAVADILDAYAADLDAVRDALRKRNAPGSRRTLAAMFAEGNRGVARIPGKHGQDAQFTALIVVVSDTPGELARLLSEIGAAGVNIEDLRLEHSPRAPIGLAEIWVVPDARVPLIAELEANGWRII